MQINPSKFTGLLVGIISLGLLGWCLYFFYGVMFSGVSSNPTAPLTAADVAIFGPKLQKAGAVMVDPKQKVALTKKDFAFTELTLFKSFTDLPEVVPMSDSRGRPDPFAPYVAP
jgi:hypothetical protein